MLKIWAHAGFAPGVVDAQTPELTDGGRRPARRRRARVVGQDHGRRVRRRAACRRRSRRPPRIAWASPSRSSSTSRWSRWSTPTMAARRRAEVPSAWPEHVELLARHAGRVPRSADRAQRGACAGRTAVAATLVDVSKPTRKARSASRGCSSRKSSCITRPQVDEGRRSRDLRQRLHAHIERARQLYEERVPSDLRARTDYLRGGARSHAGRRRSGAAGTGFVNSAWRLGALGAVAALARDRRSPTLGAQARADWRAIGRSPRPRTSPLPTEPRGRLARTDRASVGGADLARQGRRAHRGHEVRRRPPLLLAESPAREHAACAATSGTTPRSSRSAQDKLDEARQARRRSSTAIAAGALAETSRRLRGRDRRGAERFDRRPSRTTSR